jgi:tetratricopeptide (TPR) repeat protein
MDDSGRAQYARAIQLLQRYQSDWDINNLNSAIEAGQLALNETPENHADRAARSSDLATMFAQRYQRNKSLEDLNHAIEFASDAVASAPIGYTLLPAFLSNLGSYFGMRYDDIDGNSDKNDLDQAIAISQRAIDSATDDDPELPSYLDSLATHLERRSTLGRSNSEKNDAQKSVELGKLVLKLTLDDDDNLPIYMNNLGNHFQSLHEQDNKVEYLDDAIKWTRLAISMINENNPMWLPLKNNLGIELERRYDQSGKREDLDEAIQTAYEVVNLTEDVDPKLPNYLNTLAVKIANLYNRMGSVEDLEEAIKLSRRALDIAPKGHHDRADWLNNIGNLLESLFRRTGIPKYIVESVEVAQQAVDLTRAGHPDRAGYLVNLSNNLETRFEATGHACDLDAALQFAEEAINSTAESDTRRGAFLKGLGTKFIHRYEINRDINDLEEAVRFAREALGLVSEGQRVYPSYLSNLATALGAQFQRTRAIELLEEAIKLSRNAVKLTERSEQDYAAWQIGLANYLCSRYDHGGGIADGDLDEAIRLAQDTVELTKGEHMDREPSMESLAAVLSKRYKKSQKLSDLEESIRLTQQVLDATSEENPYWSTYMRNMGIRLLNRYELIKEPTDLDSALQNFVHLSKTLQATPLDRIEGTRAAIRILQTKEDWEQANKLASEALNLLPLVCGRYLGLQDQQYVLAQTSGLAADACSLALKKKNVEEAILRLERGRGIMVGYMIESRSDLSMLKKDCPALAKRYETLHYKASRKTDSRDATARQLFLKERRDAVQEIEVCVQEIRKNTDHKRFLLGPTIEELKRASSDGPIVLVNVTDISADALIVSPKKIEVVELPNFLDKTTPPDLKQEIKSYETSSRGDYDRDVEIETEPRLESDRLNLSWLWTNCVKVILEKLGSSTVPRHNALPRVWWIGTGIASSLPFHAAGVAFANSTENTLSHIIPSYAHSIKTLLYSRSRLRQSIEQATGKCSVLVVKMSTTPGQLPLPGVEDEANAIRKVCTGVYSVEVLSQPTAEDVSKKLSGIDIVHFACHALSDSTDPSNSHLLLQKPGEKGFIVDRLKLSQIAGVVTGGQAQLAFLSACSTAEVKVGKLADEGLHLANAFQVAGFGQVIGALWSANDEVSARLAELFYVDLVKASQSMYRESIVASTLRNAVLQVRTEYSESPELWAPFVHLGA